MRLLGTLAPQAAQRFAHALRTRGVATSLRPEADGTVGIWIHNEDQLITARDELDAFERNPASARFDPPPPPLVPDNEPNSAPRQRPWEGFLRAWRRLPVTSTLIAVSVISSLLAWGGDQWPGHDIGSRTRQAFSIASYSEIQVGGRPAITWNELDEISSGQVWRLVTPVFLHGGLLHLLFNMSWMWLLGGAVETVRGPWRMALLALVGAIASNLAEYYFDFGFDFSTNGLDLSGIGYDPNPLFLGMSGVITTLFGFVWMRSRLLPRSGFLMPRDTVVWMLIWLLICTSGLVGPIANVAHGVGLLVGMIFGAAPRLWTKRASS